MSSQPIQLTKHQPEVLFRTTGAQLASLPSVEGRTAERRVVNLAADLREPGAMLVDVEVADLSTDGFMIRCESELEPGAVVWLKLPGFAPLKSEIIWAEDGKAGCKFALSLYPGQLDEIIKSQPKVDIRGAFSAPTRVADAPKQPHPPEQNQAA